MVAGAVVAHHALDADVVLGKPRDGAPQEFGGGCAALVVEHFDVGQAGRVVDADVHVFPADHALAAAPAAALKATIAVHAMAGAAGGESARAF